ncbi:MAG: nickel-dependent lactate racemase [Oscillospiraceae bacterium]|nr:nickel-dependent lactate racemase [Oscillospiraceae bacterium]
MQVLQFPYGKTYQQITLPKKQLKGVLQSRLHGYDPGKTPEELVAEALRAPIGTPTLAELARGKQKVVLIASDHTRPVPSKVIVPPMLEEIRKGNPQAEITILIATGCHRGTTKEELVEKFGPELVERERIVIHDCDDKENLVSVGTLPSGGELVVNRLAVEADLLVSEGFIEPHFFAGFSGGRKSVLPGIAGRQSVLANHCSEFIASPYARTGILEGNPIHRDMIWAAEAVGLAFIVNVVINGEKQAIHAVAGDPLEAHAAGCAFLDGLCRVTAQPADIVITTNGGYPLDQNIYQAVKGMTAAESVVKKGGVIIMLARSNDGHGGEAFCRQMSEEPELEKTLAAFLARGRNETLPDQWQSQVFIRVLLHATVIYISEAPDQLVRSLHMLPAHSLEEAMKLAEELLQRPEPSILAIPDGVSVIGGREE